MSVETGPVGPSVSWWLRFSAWLGRIWRAFIRALSPPEPLPSAPVSPAPAPPPSGYVFTFRVHATFHWSAEGVYQEQLSSLMDALAPYPIRRLKALAARHARNHAPHRAREMEQELQQVLTDGGPWPFAWRGIMATCRPYVWVELDEQVKEAVRPYWEQLIRLDCEHDVRVRRAEYTERLSRQWTDILTDLLGSPAAAGAAEMTEKELAEVVGGTQSRREPMVQPQGPELSASSAACKPSAPPPPRSDRPPACSTRMDHHRRRPAPASKEPYCN